MIIECDELFVIGVSKSLAFGLSVKFTSVTSLPLCSVALALLVPSQRTRVLDLGVSGDQDPR